eukprot:4739633-Amphidinium_carterae.1
MDGMSVLLNLSQRLVFELACLRARSACTSLCPSPPPSGSHSKCSLHRPKPSQTSPLRRVRLRPLWGLQAGHRPKQLQAAKHELNKFLSSLQTAATN